MKHALLFICAAICTMFINGCETVPQGSVDNKVTFSGGYIPVEQADVPPKPLSQTPVSVPHPLSMVKAGSTGTALISFSVELNGHTSHVQIESASDQAFGEAAKKAVEQWVFTPALRNGVPVRVTLEVPFTFSVNFPK